MANSPPPPRRWTCPECDRSYALPAGALPPALCPRCNERRPASPGETMTSTVSERALFAAARGGRRAAAATIRGLRRVPWRTIGRGAELVALWLVRVLGLLALGLASLILLALLVAAFGFLPVAAGAGIVLLLVIADRLRRIADRLDREDRRPPDRP